LVPAETLRQIQQLRFDEISVKTATRITGLSRRRILQLISAGLLARQRKWLSRKAVEELLRRPGASHPEPARGFDRIPFCRALRLHIPVSLTAQFIRSVRDGSLAVVFPKGVRLLSEAMIGEACCRDWVARVEREDLNGLTVPQCATTLRLKQQVVYHLVRVGLLKAQTARTTSGHKAQLTSLDELERFKKTYMPLACLAAEFGVDHRSSLNWARSQGLRLISGPTIDGGRQYFVLRPLDSKGW